MAYLIFFIKANLFFLVPLVGFGLAYYFLNGLSSSNIIDGAGWTTYAVLGSIGTPVHEISHLIMNLVFHHKIDEIALYRPIKGKEDGRLGYVSFRYSNSLYQQVGVFFSAIAPMLGGTALILLIAHFLLPDTFAQIVSNVNSDMGFIDIVKHTYISENVFRIAGFFFISCLISFKIDISSTDLKNATTGGIVVELLLLVVSLAMGFFQVDVSDGMKKLAMLFIGFLSIGLFFTVLTLLLSFLCMLVKARD